MNFSFYFFCFDYKVVHIRIAEALGHNSDPCTDVKAKRAAFFL